MLLFLELILAVRSVEITAFSDRHGEFEKLDTEILGVSVDSVVMFCHLNSNVKL